MGKGRQVGEKSSRLLENNNWGNLKNNNNFKKKVILKIINNVN